MRQVSGAGRSTWETLRPLRERSARLRHCILVCSVVSHILICYSFTTAKNFSFKTPRRKHVLLTSEGLAYFSIALLDFLVHVIPAVDRSLGVFKPLDILTGPLLLDLLLLSGR